MCHVYYTRGLRFREDGLRLRAAGLIFACKRPYRNGIYTKDSIYKTGQSYNHPTAPLYAGMAQANARLFNKCVEDNYEYFKNFTGK